jgi:hypothetical protein
MLAFQIIKRRVQGNTLPSTSQPEKGDKTPYTITWTALMQGKREIKNA